MPEIKNILKRDTLLICIIMIVTLGCGPLGAKNNSGQTPAKLVSGKDYMELKRVRILDEMAFDKPVEAMSILIPKDWQFEGSIRWKGIGECRGEIVSNPIKVTSPDKQISYTVLPVRSFSYSQDPMTQSVLNSAAQQGGCQVSRPFTAEEYLKNLARNSGASVSDVRADETLQALLDKLSATNNSTSQQYGTGMNTSGDGIYATLEFSDGSKGLAQIGVMNMVVGSRDLYGTGPNGFSTTVVFHQVILRYPASREAEAFKIFGTISASARVNPVWKQAKDNFLTQLGNTEHAGRMERLRLMGEQARSYAKQQSDAADARMRDWERQQASTDSNQHRFIQTIREVETWNDSQGNPVELSAGYKYGWSKPDGSFILTDNSLFNPAVEFQQNWERMKKQPE